MCSISEEIGGHKGKRKLLGDSAEFQRPGCARECPCGGEGVAPPRLMVHEQLMEHPCTMLTWHHISEPKQDKAGIYAGLGAVVATGDWLYAEGLTK